ncbi:Hypothetical protein KNT65_gp089 [Escherichia phage EcS1]|uniref:Uncharacterized protein n=1 Tax=Escherichia phage EcS1 TaxID=2083276 RepID=A0A2Z5ZCD3_9CAUD|nr:Hypothetical protein KNT65_gp089 [Escherichia phage EcS1]BBC78137.1 Hypothetical protein [Escherichia phage EcS1]
MTTRSKFLIALCIIISVMFTFSHNNDYMSEKSYTVETTQLYSGQGTGRYASTEFIGVFKTEDNVYFDLRLKPSTYSQLKVGEKVVFDLRPMDIKQTPMENLIWFFGGVILWSISIVGGIVCLIGIAKPSAFEDNDEY